jgi:hypothetical protein
MEGSVPNPPCQHSLWEEIRAPGENPRLSVERWLTLFIPKGGFPFSGKNRAIDFLRPLYFEIQAIKRNGWGWLHAFEKKVIAKSRSSDFSHWMEIRLKCPGLIRHSYEKFKGRLHLQFLLRFPSSEGCEWVDKLWMFRWEYTRNSSTRLHPSEEENRVLILLDYKLSTCMKSLILTHWFLYMCILHAYLKPHWSFSVSWAHICPIKY